MVTLWVLGSLLLVVIPFIHPLHDIPCPEPFHGIWGDDVKQLIYPHANGSGCFTRVVGMVVACIFSVSPSLPGWEGVESPRLAPPPPLATMTWRHGAMIVLHQSQTNVTPWENATSSSGTGGGMARGGSRLRLDSSRW